MYVRNILLHNEFISLQLNTSILCYNSLSWVFAAHRAHGSRQLELPELPSPNSQLHKCSDSTSRLSLPFSKVSENIKTMSTIRFYPKLGRTGSFSLLTFCEGEPKGVCWLAPCGTGYRSDVQQIHVIFFYFRTVK